MSKFSRRFLSLGVAAGALSLAGQAPAQEAAAQDAQPFQVAQATTSDSVVVTARRRQEDLQSVPVPVSVIGGPLLADSGTGNVLKLKELVPTLQIYSSNPRNTAINIRGLGTTFGLTNDGVDIGVGLYVDGVFWPRAAQATLDFIDVDRIEVLRGPQGTLYGKNTTAGAINVTTKKPSFDPSTDFELTYGDYGYLQSKFTTTGPLTDKLAGRLSFSGTQRDGMLRNVSKNNSKDDLNDQNNLGVRGSLLYNFSDDLEVILAGDYTRQRPEGYAQVPVRVVPTYRTANRQVFGIIDSLNATQPGLNYSIAQPIVSQTTITSTTVNGVPSGPSGIYAELDPFVRVSDADVPHRSYQDIDGEALTVNWNVGPGTLTSITAHRKWEWYPSNDRDFLGLPITTQSANRSTQEQKTQEFRYAGDISDSINFVVGAFAFHQTVETHNTQSQGSAAARWLIDPRASNVYTGSDGSTTNGSIVAFQPDLINGLTQLQNVYTNNTSAALFGQLEWRIGNLRLIPGLRNNYDKKSTDFNQPVFGGLAVPSTSALQAAKNGVLASLAYKASVDETNLSGQFTAAYDLSDKVNLYATYAKGYKPAGLNVAGVPTTTTPIVIKPESVVNYEAGIKTKPFTGATLNVTAFNTDIEDYQTNVVASVVNVLRGYLANAEQVRVRGLEFDSTLRVTEGFSLYANAAYTDAKYVSFTNAPLALEDTGKVIANPNGAGTISATSTDISGKRLPGISKWAGAIGGEYSVGGQKFLGHDGEFFLAADVSARSKFSSDPSGSAYMDIEGYSLVNARVGFRGGDGWDVYLWGRNLADTEYYEILAAQSGGAGLVVGSLGDPRTVGITLRGHF
jgi:iron complex outermembrane receptor protein